MQFRKKPVVIEAFEWKTGYVAPAWFDEARNLGIVGADKEGGCFIKTLEGLMRARPGDWIIRGVKGEIYPCKPDIFAATYEAAV
jgi:hypothetical protein